MRVQHGQSPQPFHSLNFPVYPFRDNGITWKHGVVLTAGLSYYSIHLSSLCLKVSARHWMYRKRLCFLECTVPLFALAGLYMHNCKVFIQLYYCLLTRKWSFTAIIIEAIWQVVVYVLCCLTQLLCSALWRLPWCWSWTPYQLEEKSDDFICRHIK